MYCLLTTCTVCPSSINQTDQMLVHLQSFNSVPENYTIPESTKNGVPLFYIPPGSTTPVLILYNFTSNLSYFISYLTTNMLTYNEVIVINKHNVFKLMKHASSY